MDSTTPSNAFLGFSVGETRSLTSTYLFGSCAGWMFSSFMIVQAFTYFRHYKNDSKFLKSIVCVVIFLQLAQTALESYNAYVIDSAGWGDPTIILNVPSTVADDIVPFFESITAFIVQWFFTWRIWTFSTAFLMNSKIRLFTRLVCAFIALVSTLSLAAALTIGINSLTADAFFQWVFTVIVLWNAASAVADITITICMMALLLHAKAGSHLGETRDLLSRLTRVVLETGLLTTVLALLDLPLVTRRMTGIYTLPWYILGKSEVISLLANLNSRKRSNAPVVHGSDNDQAAPATKLSTVVFLAAANRHTTEETGFSDSIVTSHPVVQMSSQNGSTIHADVAEESDSPNEEKTHC